MQSFHVLHLLISISLTTTFVDAQYYNEARCPSMCGDVKIAYPFGIGRYCSANKWYTVDCKSSTVPYPSSTPYLSALNNVEILYISSTTLIVNMSINNPDCKNPIQDSNLGLSKSPFRFSGLYNILVVQGCGSGVIVDENGTIVAGCSTTCGNDTVSDINNCFGVGCCQTTIPHGLESFTFNLTGLERKELYGKESCGSAFIVNTYYAGTFSRQSMIADHTFFPISLSWNNSTGCKDTCGEVMIPYPFGMGSYCSRDKWFNVDCNSSTPYLSAFNNVQMLGVDLERGRVTVNVSKISGCDNSYNLVLSGSPFRFSRLDNLFVVEGCGNAAIMDENGTIVAGCSTTCEIDSVIGNINNCFGVDCCQTKIPYDIGQSFTLNQTGLEKHGGNGSCGHAFLVDRKSFIEGRLISGQFVPITLGYTESDYDVSTECISCEELGGYCYPSRFVISYMACFYESNRKSHNGVILGVSISTGVLLLTAITYALCKRIKKTKVKRRKQRCFKRNGGLLLKQQEATHSGFVDKTILFTSNELEKATDNYNENRILGKGGQGTVYKGMLADGRIVAIKKSKVVDESQLEQFINEVVILSQVSHRNVVKLMGCCLETEVPLLVSEFISNGTLYDFIQDESSEFSISLNMRLQIATEVAGALSYLHSSTSVPIYHRDIKSTNILLDEKYRAKVSDFGTSRFVSIDHSHLTTLVKGTFGYLDPEYFQSSQFTDKSDVYSFGVVLLELLTREKPIFSTRFGEYKSLATHFMETMEEGRVLTVFDAMVVEEGSRSELLAIANLASRCLNLKGKHRPTMKEVALELEGLRLSHVPSTSHTISGHLEYGEKVPQIYYGSTSTSTSLTCDDDHINESW